MSLPLQGYRVIELAQIYAGPYCGLQLAHFGAEVIKIEPPGAGELLRKRPPAKHGTNYGFLMLNTGKKSVSLNLKDPRGRDILFRMLADSDVILENYAPGALERCAREGWEVPLNDTAKRGYLRENVLKVFKFD